MTFVPGVTGVTPPITEPASYWFLFHGNQVLVKYAGGEIEVDLREIAEADWYTVDTLPNIPGRMSIARKLIDWYVEQNS